MSSSVGDLKGLVDGSFVQKSVNLDGFIDSNRLKYAESVSVVKCKYCGELFAVARGRGRPVAYCSDECRTNARKEQSRLKSYRWYHRHKHELSEKQRWGLGSGWIGGHRNIDFSVEEKIVCRELARLGLK